jgi:hypothetical protein
MDLTMDPGERWKGELLQKVGTCQVLVCLVSVPYLTNSEWCAMEWDAFTQREVYLRSDGTRVDATAIIPVLWGPPDGLGPSEVDEVSRFIPRDMCSAEVAGQYRAQGLKGLMFVGGDAEYRPIVWSLARSIARIHNQYWVKPLVPAGHRGLRTRFRPASA